MEHGTVKRAAGKKNMTPRNARQEKRDKRKQPTKQPVADIHMAITTVGPSHRHGCAFPGKASQVNPPTNPSASQLTTNQPPESKQASKRQVVNQTNQPSQRNHDARKPKKKRPGADANPKDKYRTETRKKTNEKLRK